MSDSRKTLHLMLALVLILSIVATVIMLVTDSASAMKVAVLAGLWAGLIGFFLASKYRRDAEIGEAELEQERAAHQHALEMEQSAHRRKELEIERRLRDEISESNDTTLQEIKDQLEQVRTQLEQLRGEAFGYEHVALKAHATRIAELETSNPAPAATAQRHDDGDAVEAEPVAEPVTFAQTSDKQPSARDMEAEQPEDAEVVPSTTSFAAVTKEQLAADEAKAREAEQAKKAAEAKKAAAKQAQEAAKAKKEQEEEAARKAEQAHRAELFRKAQAEQAKTRSAMDDLIVADAADVVTPLTKKQGRPIGSVTAIAQPAETPSIKVVGEPTNPTPAHSAADSKPANTAQDTKPASAAQDTKPASAAQDTKPAHAAGTQTPGGRFDTGAFARVNWNEGINEQPQPRRESGGRRRRDEHSDAVSVADLLKNLQTGKNSKPGRHRDA